MTKDHFQHLLSTVLVRLVAGGKHYGPGLHVEGITQEDLSEIITLAGDALDAIPKNAKVNPDYLSATGYWHMLTAPGVVLPNDEEMKVRYEPTNDTRWCFTHNRVATHLRFRDGCKRPDLNPPEHCCDPHLGGITMPCRCWDFAEKQSR